MKKKILLSQVILSALFSLGISAQTTDLVKYLPEKARMIIDIDGSSLSQKLSWKELTGMKFFDSLLKKAEPATRKMIAEPSETGINFHEHLYFVINLKEEEENSSANYFALYGKVEDENKLSQLLEKSEDKKITRKTSGQNKMLIGDDFLFGWNNSVFVLYTATNFFKGSETHVKQKESQKKKELARMEKKCVDLLTPRTQNIYNNKYFEEMVQQKGDIRIWIDNNHLNNSFKQKGPLALFKKNDQFQGDYKTVNVNFEKGKVVSHASTYYNDSISAFIQKMYASNLNADLIKKIPEGNLLGVFAMSFKPEAIKDFIKKTGVMEDFKTLDKKNDFDPIPLLESLKGDVMIALNMPEHPVESEENPFSGMQIFFAATVNDENKVNRFIDSVKLLMAEKKKIKDSINLDKESITKESDMFKNMKPTMRVKNGLFVLALSEDHLAEFFSGSNNNHNDLINEYSQNPMLLMFDLKTFMSIAMSSLKKQNNPGEDPEMYSFFQIFDKLIIASGKFENGAMLTTQEVKFSDPEENSLKQMMRMIDLVFSAVSNSSKAKKIEVKEN
jgi:hypothetical protein